MSSQYPESPRSALEFAKLFPDNESCIEYLAQWRWPDGFRCPRCEGDRATRLTTRPLWECRNCGHQTSVTAGTALHRTKLPLTIWLYALWRLSTNRTSISALQLQRETGVGSYETAWSLLHKVRRVLGESDQYQLRREAIEVDESQVGGKGTGMGRRLGESGAWIVAAVERIEVNRPDKKPYQASGSARMEVVRNTGAKTLDAFVNWAVLRGSHIVTDAWHGYDHLEDQGYVHEVHVLRGDSTVIEATQPKVHLLFSNLKALINGTFHGVSPRHLWSYLREYVYRFNRRRYGERTFGFMVRRVMTGPWTSRATIVAEATG